LIYNLDDVTLVMKAAPDGVIFVDQDSGAEVEVSLDDEGATFIYVESGEVIASVSDEKFMELLESSVLIRDATGAPTVYYLAWSNDRGSSWNVLELPGQSPETSTRVIDAVVTQDGTVLMVLDESSLGRLFDPDEITGQLTEEEFDQRSEEQFDGLGEDDFWMRILRTKIVPGS
jgi:hypothetical protein